MRSTPGRNSAPLLPPQMKLHFVQRSMESRHFESRSAHPPCSPLSPPCCPLILKSLATPLPIKLLTALISGSAVGLPLHQMRGTLHGIFVNLCYSQRKKINEVVHPSGNLLKRVFFSPEMYFVNCPPETSINTMHNINL